MKPVDDQEYLGPESLQLPGTKDTKPTPAGLTGLMRRIEELTFGVDVDLHEQLPQEDMAAMEATLGGDEEERVHRMINKLFDHWELSKTERLALWPRTSHDAGVLFFIHSSLRTLFPYDRGLAYTWVKTPNRAFDAKPPLEAMITGRTEDVIKYLKFSISR